MEKLRKLFFAVSFTNPTVVPSTLKWIKPDDSVRFKGMEVPGLSHEWKKTSLENIFFDLEKEGLFIQNGYAQKRTSEKKMFYTTVKFEFGTERVNTVEEELLKKSFLDIFEKAFWTVKIFSHDTDITVACVSRVSRFEGNDRLKPVKIWDKDSITGERTGNEPRVIEPDGVLSFSDGSLVLEKYE